MAATRQPVGVVAADDLVYMLRIPGILTDKPPGAERYYGLPLVTKERSMASPAMNEYFCRLADEHRAKARASDGAERTMHRDKADQYDRLAGKRDLYRSATAA